MKKAYNFIIKGLATGFGLGYLPWVPGTWGSLGAIVPFYLMTYLSSEIYLSISIFLFIIGIYICQRAANLMVDTNKQKNKNNKQYIDDPRIVWDEWIGVFISLYPCVMLKEVTIMNVFIGFILFRLFDMTKSIPPLGWIDKNLDGGFGIMLDDLVAGFYVMLILFAIIAFS